MAGATTQGANLLIRGQFKPFIYIHTPLAQQREQFGVKCLAQGHIDMWTGEAEPPIFQLEDDRSTALPLYPLKIIEGMSD